MKKFKRLLIFSLVMLLAAVAVVVFMVSRGTIGVPTFLDDPPAPTTVPLAVTAESLTPPGLTAPEHPIALPPGFAIAVYARGLQSPRMMAIGLDGQLYVAERGAGRIVRLPDLDHNGVVDGIEVVADGLNAPSSLAFYQDGSLYVGETTQVLRLSLPDDAGVFHQRQVIISGLPEGGHSTRTVLFSPDWQYLFVSIGSSCNVCNETDERRAAIMRYAPNGSNEQVYASGLRNAVGITFRPGTMELWATNNGRDMLGDNLPPETIYHVQPSGDHGWPRCHAGRIIDPEFGASDACEEVVDPVVEIQAHSAPLGLTFYSGTQFPQEYQGDLFVAFHGSWNRSVPTGYMVAHIPIAPDGTAGPVQEFAVGWLLPDGTRWGRPVDIVISPTGSMFISDDFGGYIYRVFYLGD